jgi:hypothetical protein
MRSTNLDVDWFYRKGVGVFMWFIYKPMGVLGSFSSRFVFDTIPTTLTFLSRNPVAILRICYDRFLWNLSGEQRKHVIEERIRREKDIYPGDIIKHWPIGSTVLWVTIFLFACLLLYYI